MVIGGFLGRRDKGMARFGAPAPAKESASYDAARIVENSFFARQVPVRRLSSRLFPGVNSRHQNSRRRRK